MNRHNGATPGGHSRRWTPSPLLYGSAVVHLGATATTLAQPGAWPWALGAVLADHLALAAAGLLPRSGLLGPNYTRLPFRPNTSHAVAITIDDGPDPNVTPQVLALLAKYGALATFFCIGERVERHPDLAREIVRRGHSIENHSQRHKLTFSLLGPRAISEEISIAQESIRRVTGCNPSLFRAPMGMRNPFLEPVLARLQLRLVSWTRRGFDSVNGNADSVYRRLVHSLKARDILLLHDGNAARNGEEPVIIKVLPRLLQTMASQQLQAVTLRSVL